MSATAKGPDTAQKIGGADLARTVSQPQRARPSRQQAANACVEYWNEVLAAEGSFADERSVLSNAGAGEKQVERDLIFPLLDSPTQHSDGNRRSVVLSVIWLPQMGHQLFIETPIL